MATDKNTRKQLVDTIMNSMKDRDSIWQKTWTSMSEPPYNPITGTKYSGINLLTLALKQTELNTQDSRWCTFKQAVAAGFKINKDSKAAHAHFYDLEISLKKNDQKQFIHAKSTKEYASKIINYYKAEYPDKSAAIEQSSAKIKPSLSKDQLDKKQFIVLVDELNKVTGADIKLSTTVVLKSFPIFNYSQLQNVPALEVKPVEPFKPIKRAEEILLASGAKIFHDNVDRNYYSPKKHEIHLTKKESFKTPEAYYSTALHEIGHWTKGDGLPRDLRVAGENNGYHMAYAREELRAELASVFTSSDLHLKLDIQNHAAYLGSYLEVLSKDHNEFFAAVNDAQKISHHVLNFEKRLDLESTDAKTLETKNPELYQKIVAYKAREASHAAVPESTIDQSKQDLPSKDAKTSLDNSKKEDKTLNSGLEEPEPSQKGSLQSLETFFEEKKLPFKEFTITHEGKDHFISNEVVIDYLVNSIDTETQVQVMYKLIKLDFANADINHFLEHCANGMVLQRDADMAMVQDFHNESKQVFDNINNQRSDDMDYSNDDNEFSR